MADPKKNPDATVRVLEFSPEANEQLTDAFAGSGEWDYRAGIDGSPTLPDDAQLLGITAHATTAGSMSINGGDSIPIPANATVYFTPARLLVSPVLVFTGTDSWIVEFVV